MCTASDIGTSVVLMAVKKMRDRDSNKSLQI